MNINWNLQGCGGVPTKQPYMESMDIFWKQTISIPVMDSKVHKDGDKKRDGQVTNGSGRSIGGGRVSLKLLEKIYNLYIYIFS